MPSRGNLAKRSRAAYPWSYIIRRRARACAAGRADARVHDSFAQCLDAPARCGADRSASDLPAARAVAIDSGNRASSMDENRTLAQDAATRSRAPAGGPRPSNGRRCSNKSRRSAEDRGGVAPIASALCRRIALSARVSSAEGGLPAPWRGRLDIRIGRRRLRPAVQRAAPSRPPRRIPAVQMDDGGDRSRDDSSRLVAAALIAI